MSQGPTRSPHEERHKRLPPLGSRPLPPISNPGNSAVSYDLAPNVTETQNVSARQSQHLQQQQQQQDSSIFQDQRPSRPIGVQNLLNPASSEDFANSQNRRRNGEHLDSPPGATPVTAIPRAGTPSLHAPSLTNRSPVNISLPSITPPSISAYPQPLGRSPSAYAPSPVTMNNPSGTMDVKESPFVLPREHPITGGPGTLGPPEMSRVPSLSGDSYGSGLPSTRSPPGRRGSQDSTHYDRMQTLLGRTGGVGTGSHPPPSQSDSPSTQYSSYSQVSRQTPPAQQSVSTSQLKPFFTTPFNAGGPASSMAQVAFDVPASSSAAGGNTYHIMTLDTENGPIQVPVDVQAASKVADEKRKRNATASHRFRQRRKEKERETSQNISKLEQQIREMEEEKEFYRGERDYFRNLATRIPGQTYLLPRPASPRQRRHVSLSGTMGYGNVQYPSPENGSRNGGRNIRRRTSAYVPPSGPPPQGEAPPPVSMPQYERPQPNLPEHRPGSNRGRLQDPLPLQTASFDPSTMQ